MKAGDEPILEGDNSRNPESGESSTAVVDKIRRLVRSQPYGVLCTHGDQHAYGSLVAHAFSEDLKSAVFATPVATRKFRLLTEHGNVALVIDDRPDTQDIMMNVEAITVTGRARVVEESDRDQWAQMLIARHPQLEAFVTSQSCALFQVEIKRVFHVSRFQEVKQWVPAPA